MAWYKNKFHAKKVTLNGRQFDSLKESQRYIELERMARAGRIKNLQCQVEFVLIPKQTREDGSSERKCAYIADFTYDDVITGKHVVEDVKSAITRKQPEYIIKRKLMLHHYGITIKEV